MADAVLGEVKFIFGVNAAKQIYGVGVQLLGIVDQPLAAQVILPIAFRLVCAENQHRHPRFRKF